MNQKKSILHQLTTNLSFRSDNCSYSSINHPKVVIAAVNPGTTILNGIEAVIETKSNKIPPQIQPTKDLQKINKERINHLRNLNRININGNDVPDPIETIDQIKNQLNLADEAIPDRFFENFYSLGFSQLTPVQMQSMPVMLSNREIMVCAPTGSGKTFAYLFPVLAKLKAHEKNGARALILCPTRELARQIYIEACHLAEGTGLKVKILNKTANELKTADDYAKKYDLLITTPNKLIFLLDNEVIKSSMKRIDWMIIDEADRLFEDGDKGFREQLAKIYKACDSPKIKHALFSATLTNEIQEWFRNSANNLVEVSIGRKNVTALGIDQELVYVANESGKLLAIKNLLKGGFQPPILIFVQSKKRANDLFKELVLEKVNVDVISGDRSQPERDSAIRNFRLGKTWALISTELMSRGIDFKYVNSVINYDFPQTAISYIHRIGRSGRAGNIGKAVTYFSDSDLPYLRSIANIIREAGCTVPEYMLKLRKPSKKLKRKLANKAPRRKKINDKD